VVLTATVVTRSDMDANLPDSGQQVMNPCWEPWSPGEVAERLADVPVLWYVAGGWALNLHRGQITRAHEDLEIAVPAAGFGAIRQALGELDFVVAGDGRIWPLDSPAYGLWHQTWGRDRASRVFRVDVFREPHEAGTWICRRDPRLRRPYEEIILATADGLPYLTPEVVLLFKAKHRCPKDNADFAATLPLLNGPQRGWLTAALQMVHPQHPWLTSLGHRPPRR
jgi:Aminoglycoside-2''-adenylyltransferase